MVKISKQPKPHQQNSFFRRTQYSYHKISKFIAICCVSAQTVSFVSAQTTIVDFNISQYTGAVDENNYHNLALDLGTPFWEQNNSDYTGPDLYLGFKKTGGSCGRAYGPQTSQLQPGVGIFAGHISGNTPEFLSALALFNFGGAYDLGTDIDHFTFATTTTNDLYGTIPNTQVRVVVRNSSDEFFISESVGFDGGGTISAPSLAWYNYDPLNTDTTKLNITDTFLDTSTALGDMDLSSITWAGFRISANGKNGVHARALVTEFSVSGVPEPSAYAFLVGLFFLTCIMTSRKYHQ